MDITVSFREPHVITGETTVCETALEADRLLFGEQALRVLAKKELVLDVPYRAVTVVELPARRSLARLRERNPRAYQPWSSEEEAMLLGGLGRGETLEALCAGLGRGRNAVLARMVKLGVFSGG